MTDETGPFLPEMPGSHKIPQLSERFMSAVGAELEIVSPPNEARPFDRMREMTTAFAVRCVDTGEQGIKFVGDLAKLVKKIDPNRMTVCDRGIGLILE